LTVDSSGNVYVADSGNNRVQKFTEVPLSPDTKAPKIKSVNPAEDATGIARGANLTATFSEAMRAYSINANTIKLYKEGTTTALPARVSYDATTKKAILTPDAYLRLGTKYKAVVTTGARDLAGNPLSAKKVWYVTTRRR
jgi:hypothetical protein